ncbi:toxin-antitoxin system [Corynebacterium sp. CNCTC7651]|uniref:FitA-like ribbon-helix-helix domain-containing protein n=1 Tax=Corynebacterium sp. CNCTC7651 TaxID=2815361 RepID=UPI001F252BAD|nr:toxin-antitoxin system [Corynebacterium sp. CNCTC7651]UIZ93074.1 toxin-antitoxin system [Corynebacterium sp. CNCTC7651]
MASLIVRNLDERVKEALAERARLQGRSMEAEVRDILHRAVAPTNPLEELHQLVSRADASVDLELPDRVIDERKVDFS